MHPIQSISIDGFEYIPRQMTPEKTGDYSIIRCRNAGVHFGKVVHRDSEIVKVEGSRRLWRWWSKATLSELAMEGPLPAKIDAQKYGCVLPLLELTTSDVCEVIACTEVAARAILAVPEWVAHE
jgi:hypothetical protein